jgi:hypothetical protein
LHGRPFELNIDAGAEKSKCWDGEGGIPAGEAESVDIFFDFYDNNGSVRVRENDDEVSVQIPVDTGHGIFGILGGILSRSGKNRLKDPEFPGRSRREGLARAGRSFPYIEAKMNFGTYGILIIFGAFVLILILNPNLSCFGKRLKSPLYPLFRKRGRTKARPRRTEDYGLNLGGESSASRRGASPKADVSRKVVTEDYGFRLRDKDKEPEGQPMPPGEDEAGD